MKKILLNVLLLYFGITCFAQAYRRNENWIIGFAPAIIFNFNGPLLIDTLPNVSATYQASCISDTNGNFLFYMNGFNLVNYNCQHVQDGTYLNCPQGVLWGNYSGGTTPWDQNSIIIPKKNNQYYVFSTGMSDSVATNYINHIKTEFDVLNYAVVDMDLNGGLGKVIEKNKVILDHQHYRNAAMTAVKHANGKDWWLIKTDCTFHRYQEYLVREDSILGPFYLPISDTGDFCYGFGQIYFSEDGKQLASGVYMKIDTNGVYSPNRLDLYDFDRCDGQLQFKKYYMVPYDTGSYSLRDRKMGMCFSPNNNLLYVSNYFTVYQIDLQDTNTYNAQFIHGPDTSDLSHFPLYSHISLAPDGRLYIGNFNGTRKYMSYIEYPDSQGTACHFVPLGVWQPFTNLLDPPNMPNYGLGPDTSKICWPLQQSESGERQSEWVVYPNPASTQLYFRGAERKKKRLYNAYGVIITETFKEEIDVKNLSRGLYFLQCNNLSKKIVVE